MLEPMTFSRALDAIDWYRRCLEDIQDGRRVTGLQEAKLGYAAAMDWFKSEPRRFRVTYRSTPDEQGHTGNYVDLRGTSPTDAVQRRLTRLGGEYSCGEGAGFECEGEWFPVRWAGSHWELAEAVASQGTEPRDA